MDINSIIIQFHNALESTALKLVPSASVEYNNEHNEFMIYCPVPGRRDYELAVIHADDPIEPIEINEQSGYSGKRKVASDLDTLAALALIQSWIEARLENNT